MKNRRRHSLKKNRWVQQWICKQKHLLIYMMREYLFDTIDQLPGLHEYLEEHHYWSQICENTYPVMNTIRARLNMSLRDFQDLYPILNEQCEFVRTQLEEEQAGYFELTTKQLKGEKDEEEELDDEEEDDTTVDTEEQWEEEEQQEEEEEDEEEEEEDEEEDDENDDREYSRTSSSKSSITNPAMINVHWHPGKSIFMPYMDKILNNYNKTNLAYGWRMDKKMFERVVLHWIEDLEKKNFSGNEHTATKDERMDNYEDLSTSEVLPMVAERYLEFLIMTRTQTIKHNHALLPLEQRLQIMPSFEPLIRLFNLSVNSVLKLQFARDVFDMETDRSAVKETIVQIFWENPRDFKILSLFFKLLCKRLLMTAYPLPSNLTELQMQSIKLEYGIADESLLPPGYGRHHVCLNCGSFKGCILEPYVNNDYLDQLTAQVENKPKIPPSQQPVEPIPVKNTYLYPLVSVCN